MGSRFSRLGGKGHITQLNKWKESTWSYIVNEVEISQQLKRKLENELSEQVMKRRKC